MKDNLLFDMPDSTEEVVNKNTKRCKKCVHIRKHYYRPDWKYCTKQKSNRTECGSKKIKSMDFACNMFMERAK